MYGLVGYRALFVIDLASRRVELAGMVHQPHEASIKRMAPQPHQPDVLLRSDRLSGAPLDLARPEKPQKPQRIRPIVVTLDRLAECQRLLATGAARNRADLARLFRVSRVRITQIMKLLGLPDDVVAAIRRGDGPRRERALRLMLSKSPPRRGPPRPTT